MSRDGPILVTGSTGYVGGRLVPHLLSEGRSVRVLVRDADRLAGRGWVDAVQIAEADVLAPSTLPGAIAGVRTAYYLIHSMMASDRFAEHDLAAARAFGSAACEAGVERIVYLGGLGDPDADLSHHLRSRQATGDALRESGVPVTELRAAIIVGSGSVSFEMIRHLTERLPVMVCPRWVYTRVQPIAVRDVLAYLSACLEVPGSAGRVIEIGGADVLTYGEMMTQYAEVRGLSRFLVSVPVLTPRLSSYWVHWVTPIPASISRPLIEGLKNEVIVRTDDAARLFPEIRPLAYRDAVSLALAGLEDGRIESFWSDALCSGASDGTAVLLSEQGMIVERRIADVAAPPDAVYREVATLGGERGWPALNWAWQARGVIDRVVGGVGFRRGRRHPHDLRAGDAVDFWRVEAVRPGRLLRLRAEMKVPGRAWLQFEIEPTEPGSSRLLQTAFFAPKGLSGLLYWYVLYPVHALIFSRLVRALARRAEQSAPGGRAGRGAGTP